MRVMTKTLRLIGTFLLLCAMIIAPAQSAVVAGASSQMMEMADGSPCPPKDCAAMPECTMVLPGGGGLFSVPAPDLAAQFHPEVSPDVFTITDIMASALDNGVGLYRPPKN